MSAARGEESVDISLGAGALKDPLIEYVMPPQGSPDRVQFRPEGIWVRQYPEVKDKPSGGTGVKLLANVDGDFRCEVDFECRRLEEPVEGWGQGMMIRLQTDDPDSPVMAFGCIANQRFERCYFIQFPHGDDRPADRHVEPSEFTDGTWIIERQGDQISLAVRHADGESEEVTTMPCTAASLRGIQLWCTKQDSGNSHSEFLFKRIGLSAGSFFTYEEPPQSWWNGWTVFLVVCGINLLGYGGYWIHRRRQ